MRTNNKGVMIKRIISIALILAVAAVTFFVSRGFYNKWVMVNASNESMIRQIDKARKNVYTAVRDIEKGEKIVTSGDDANVEYSQIISSLDEEDYIRSDEDGYAQVAIKAGTPVLLEFVGDEDPTAIDRARTAVANQTIPYGISAVYVDLDTGEEIKPSTMLSLDPGVNEKSFNTPESQIDGYTLISVACGETPVHSFGVAEKYFSYGTVTMCYYTDQDGWNRHPINSNIVVTYTYISDENMEAHPEFAEYDIDAGTAGSVMTPAAESAEDSVEEPAESEEETTKEE